MNKKITWAFLSATLPFACLAQATTEITDIRFYEHHSSSINDGLPYGYGANGSQSGYDFVAHDYYESFNPATMGAWSAAEVANIDMVENNGGYLGPFGFTSETSNVWAGGTIKANDLTVYAEAPASFDYDLATDVAYIKEAFPTATSKTIEDVAVNKIYLGKIRGTEMYVAMKITAVQNVPDDAIPGVSQFDVYFDFDYKYGTFAPTSISDIYKSKLSLSIAPNPSKGSFTIANLPEGMNKNSATLSILDITGRIIHEERFQGQSVQHQLQPGQYLVQLADGKAIYRNRLVVVE
ncbi:MAG: T9SS type A sorting domain-containing protein [Taibaiella sp.]|nr:T9SS type A sorting domain-containing protein [Taibaiella sp.]